MEAVKLENQNQPNLKLVTNKRPLVLLESPYAGKVKQNIEYGQKCLADCLKRGESPQAPHLLYTQANVLDDNNPEERQLGIDAGHELLRVVDKVVVYIDKGISEGMKLGIERAKAANVPVELRSIEVKVGA
jgi:hypothetical protein